MILTLHLLVGQFRGTSFGSLRDVKITPLILFGPHLASDDIEVGGGVIVRWAGFPHALVRYNAPELVEITLRTATVWIPA